jgi:uncharacterized protein YecE (DUF72 family)
MDWWVGTSGYSYREWKGAFYPEDLPDAEMLRHYAGRLSAVEINQTFYRLPREDVLRGWAEQAPDGFRFCLKASRRITHQKRLAGAEEETGYLVRTASALGSRAGVILYQLPPSFRLDLGRLEAFLDELPNPRRSVFEFRHPSWREVGVLEALRARGAAWCTADTDETPETEPVSTADWGYLRLRRAAYAEDDLAEWAQRVRAAGWREAYVFFKHEDEATGPRLAERLLALVSQESCS